MGLQRIALTELNGEVSGRIKTLICSASFEGRCLSVPLNLDPSSIDIALVCHTDDRLEPIEPNLAKLKSHFGAKYRSVKLDTTFPVRSADSLSEELGPGDGEILKDILLDATTFTHEGLLILLRLLALRLRASSHLFLVYTPAAEYSLGSAENQKWLSKGVGEIRSVLGYPGRMLPSRKMHLILLTGFESERALELMDSYEPSVLSLGIGSDSVEPNPNQIARLAMLKKRKDSYEAFDEFTFSRMDYNKAAASISAQIEKFPGYNTVLAPMNTKLSTIGAALTAMRMPRTQLSYAQAHTYNIESYSRAADYCLMSPFPELVQATSIATTGEQSRA